MSHRRKAAKRWLAKQNRDVRQEGEGTCLRAHFDTEAKAELMQAILKKRNQPSARQYSARCQAWHIVALQPWEEKKA